MAKARVWNVNNVDIIVLLVFPLFGCEIVDFEIIVDLNTDSPHHRDPASIKIKHLHALSGSWQLSLGLKFLITKAFFKIDVRCKPDRHMLRGLIVPFLELLLRDGATSLGFGLLRECSLR
jgi:hypothetical protein